MTVTSSELIENCRECFYENGYGIKLDQKGNILVCSHDSNHRYKIQGDALVKIE